jgi:tetratricopeptide (TPR) repeat protein
MSSVLKMRVRPFFLAGILFGIHTLLIVLAASLVAASSDPETGMVFGVFYWLDYPVSCLYQFFALVLSFPVLTGVLGGVLWFLYGYVLQGLFRLRNKANLPGFLIGLVLLGLLCSSPVLYRKTLPSWQQQWEMGTLAENSQDLDGAIKHVEEAVQLSPKDNDFLYGMWDYLGCLYMQKKDYERAGAAFANALAAAKNSARDTLNVYNQLVWYNKTVADKQREKEFLGKAIEYNRIQHGGDSVQEADCMERLAEIAHEEGSTKEAQAWLEKAIAMDEHLPNNGNTFTLNYMHEELQKWSAP